ncbi:maltoporin [Chryseolinea serpens]|uniref:Maltoporin n=1 Tax=Chryseolinea serpens TaxID=947013 RepID=A0A1M5QWN1_9BACT|nr:carbohydrate porin [Chryseolinea serpens]SHH18564.1 maltoporin [Chryseolinea serpens]
MMNVSTSGRTVSVIRKSVYLLGVMLPGVIFCLRAQVPVVTNKHFSIGSYGRVGIARGDNIQYPRPLNLNGMGSIGGRMEEVDYFELATALHFAPVGAASDTTHITVQARFAFYTTQGQIIGNVTSKSYGGITTALPELFAEAKNIRGSPWTVWVGARFFRGDDIHIIDHFYFDDHSAQGFGIQYKQTQFSVMFPTAVDTASTLPPYFYLNIVNGTPVLGLRNRAVYILEHILPVKNGYLKFLAEYHRLANGTLSDTTTSLNYPADYGYVLGAKYKQNLSTRLPGSFFDMSVRFGTGIANGGDGGASKTFLTYGGPNLETQRFRKAWSMAITESILWNVSPRYSLNAYGIFTKSKGASDSLNTTLDYQGRPVFNRKIDFAIGARGTWYIKDWFHLLHELDFSSRKDGTQDPAQMIKFSIAPTVVPNGKRDVWSRPHFRLVYSVAHYNKFAADHLYSPYLAQTGSKRWGHYFGVKTEWWLW